MTCLRVSVPVDWSGTVGGRLSLSVQVRRAKHQRGVMFLLAGGPGQASTQYFELAQWSMWSRLFPGYSLVTFDPRGTGDSDPIRCDASADSQVTGDTSYGAECAQQLGAKAAFFATTDNARDIDAVRQALGFRKIGVYGASYGTLVAVGYARMFPDRVQRLVLDSVAAPLSSLPVVGQLLTQISPTLNRFCAHACTGFPGGYAHSVVQLANALAEKPLSGRVHGSGPRGHLRRLGASEFLSLVVQTDLDPGLAAELPAAVGAAQHGDAQPLLRLADVVDSPAAGINYDDAVYTATSCDDGPFPWQTDTPIADRPALLSGAITALAPGSLGGFGPWAARFSNAPLCLDWPPAPAATTTLPDAYPDVPVLAISGALDLRTPRSEAREVLAHFPHGHLLVVNNAGHAALAANGFRPCLTSALHNWLNHGYVPSVCQTPRLLAPLEPFAPVTAERSEQSARTRDLTLVRTTLHEAQAASLLASYEGIVSAIPGLGGGRLKLTRTGFALDHYGVSPRLSLTGDLRPEYDPVKKAPQLHGVVQVTSGAATIGTLAVNADVLDGSLDGITITGSPSVSAHQPVTHAIPRHAWSTWSPPRGSAATVTNAIAAHVAGEYHLDGTGAALVHVTAGPPALPSGARRAISAIEIQGTYTATSPSTFHTTLGTWSYRLCGRPPSCSIADGQPTPTRGQLVRREALELALDTFTFVPQVSSLVIFLPPPPGEPLSFALYFERSQLAKQLAKPLANTLTLPAPPLPTVPDNSEKRTIDSLTLPRLYGYRQTELTYGDAELQLTYAQ